MPFEITLAGSTAYIPTGVGGSSGSTLCSSFGCGTIFQLSLTNQRGGNQPVFEQERVKQKNVP
jgi:hypothetical protein